MPGTGTNQIKNKAGPREKEMRGEGKSDRYNYYFTRWGYIGIFSVPQVRHYLLARQDCVDGGNSVGKSSELAMPTLLSVFYAAFRALNVDWLTPSH
jgi:hypothetical protein